MNKKILGLVSSLAVVAMLAACGTTPAEETPTDNGEEPATETPAEELEGSVIVDGSGTVYPLMANIAENYMTEVQPSVSVQVGRAGSSAGLKKFVAGELDFADASRKIKDEEVAELEAGGKIMGENIMEIELAYDGLTMVINKENTWASEMTEQEIVDMYLSGTYKDDDKVLWSDIRADWPSEEVKFYGPNENHGTYEFFYEEILDKQDMVSTANLQQEYSTLVDLVSKDVNAIAFFGYGYYATNTDKLTAIKIDFGMGGVEPSLDTIGSDLDYAGFTRLVYTYLDLDKAKDAPQILDYAKYVVSPEGASKLAGDNGFAPLPAEKHAEYMTILEDLK
jgi:phosphate transport system substrate-binding protein